MISIFISSNERCGLGR